MTLRLLADENIPKSLIDRLRQLDDVVVAWAFEEARGISDIQVLSRAVEAQAVVLTADHDFGQLVMAQRLGAPGVILIRLHPIRAHLNGIVAVLQKHAAEIPGSFVVISRGRVRVRPLPARGSDG